MCTNFVCRIARSFREKCIRNFASDTISLHKKTRRCGFSRLEAHIHACPCICLAIFRFEFFIDVGTRQGLAAICSGWYSVASKVIICKLNSLPHPFPLLFLASLSRFSPTVSLPLLLADIVLFVNVVLARITG